MSEKKPAIQPTRLQVWITTTDAGEAHIMLPVTVTAADVQELEQWFRLVLRSLKKRVKAESDAR